MKNLLEYIKSERFFQLVVTILMVMFLFIELYPIIYVISASVSNANAVASGELILWPVGFTLEGYKYVFEFRDIWIGYGNTIFYTILGTCVNLIVTLPCAYAISREEVVGRGKIMIFFMIPMYIGGGLIPSYLNVQSFGLVNTRTYMIISGAISVYNMIVAKTFFATTIPREITEAAKIDGCNNLGIFSKIVMPLSKAIVTVMVLYYGVGHWNSYFGAMIYLEDREKFPLQMIVREILLQSKFAEQAVAEGGMDSAEIQYMMRIAERAGLVKYCVIIVATIPMLIIYPKLQKFFVKGVMIGSVKG